MFVTLNGHRYGIVYADLGDDDGLCDPPGKRHKKITINKRVLPYDQQHMDALLHEMQHGAMWWLDEEYVEGYATAAARVLYRVGFRRAAPMQ